MVRRRFRRRRGGYGAKAMAKKALREVKQLKSNVELKLHAVGPTAHSLSSSGTVVPLTTILQEVGVQNRIGREIVLKSVRMRCLHDTGHIVYGIGRYILFFDNECDGVLPSVAEVLNTAAIDSFPSYDGRKRYNIIFDKTFTYGEWNDKVSCLKYYKKFNRKINYSGAAGDITTQREGGLFALFISETNGAAGEFTYNFQIRFADS